MSYIITVKMHKVSMLIAAIIVGQGAPASTRETPCSFMSSNRRNMLSRPYLMYQLHKSYPGKQDAPPSSIPQKKQHLPNISYNIYPVSYTHLTLPTIYSV